MQEEILIITTGCQSWNMSGGNVLKTLEGDGKEGSSLKMLPGIP